jgi:hypothetical protein
MIDQVRELNALLALLTFGGLCYRTPRALRGVTSKRLYLVLVSFPALVGLGSIQARLQHAPAGPVTYMFTVAYAALGVTLVWWPKRLNGPPST